MRHETIYWRFRLARWLINTGLLVMPKGRCLTELTEMLWTWRRKVDATVAARRAAGAAKEV